MQNQKVRPLVSSLLVLLTVSLACSSSAAQPTSTPASTDTPEPTATIATTPTNTPRPSPTLRPTQTPNLAATQRYDEFNTQAQKYIDLGYLPSADGEFIEYNDFEYDWAQLGWYNWAPLGVTVTDFYISAQFKWSSAYRNADTSGCGFIFAIQENGDHYAVFLDRSEVLFLNADSATSYSRRVGVTRGTSRVIFDNPFDNPVEADFTLIVNGTYAYVLVNGEVTGEYTLAQSKILRGDVAVSVLSGTNKDFGTRCEMSDIHVFVPN
ncbi:MAG TPA: hypothetical protein VK851_01885 [Anaerolineales bacterium]|nr:hypothetical protein [Anaerolineales bacterium]